MRHPTRRWRRGRGLAVALIWLVLAGGANAQEPTTEMTSDTSPYKPGTYLKGGLARWQGNVFSSNSLIQWDGDLFGADYALTSASLTVESYFSRPRLLLTGFSIGYRKDNLSRAESGHMLSAKLFREFPLRVFGVKVGGGVEWGSPSFTFDQTVFITGDDGSLRYRHTYVDRNAGVPVVGTEKDGTVYPFAMFSIVQRPWGLLFEVGMRLNFMRFNLDDYLVRPDDRLTTSFNDSRVLAPYLFFDIGVRLF